MHFFRFIFEVSILKPFYRIMELYVRLSPYEFADISIGHELPPEKLDQILRFRNEMHQEGQTYLIAQTREEKRIEQDLDKRSFHAVVYSKRGEIVAATRLTPYPFETTLILGEEKTKPFKRYLEISRLVCKRKKAGIGKRLLIHSGCFAIRRKKFEGFIAICRNENYSIFQKFGLTTLDSFSYPSRGNVAYHLICANFFNVSTSTLKHFQTKLIFRMNILF